MYAPIGWIELVKEYIHDTKVDERVQIYKIFDWNFFDEWCKEKKIEPMFDRHMFRFIMSNLFEYKQ